MLHSPYKKIPIAMQTRLRILQILLILSIFQKEYTAIKCYQCSSRRDKNCTANKVHIKYLKLCPLSYSYCRKVVYVYYFMDSHDELTIRECAKSRDSQKECYRGRYARDSYQLVCECLGYACNRSQRSSPTLAIYLLCTTFLIIGYFIIKRRAIYVD